MTYNEYQFARDGRTLLVVRPQDLYVVSWAAGGPIFQLPFDDDTPAAISPDGRWLATASRTAIAVRDLRNPLALTNYEVFTGHERDVSALAFSPDGRQLVSCSFDGTALVWDMRPVHAGPRSGHRNVEEKTRRVGTKR
jgi:WD40 repeat protein